ncbi:MAG: GAF domain-containing protein [Deltaproteobacteria bacterium]|nr:GAF domain-containing protein [Deltaproteobacteria bacterium]
MKKLARIRDKLLTSPKNRLARLYDKSSSFVGTFFHRSSTDVHKFLEIRAAFVEALLKSDKPCEAFNAVIDAVVRETRASELYCFYFDQTADIHLEFPKVYEEEENFLFSKKNKKTHEYITDVLLKGKPLIISDCSKLPPEIKSVFQNSGIDSIIVIPLFVNGSLWGGVAYCSENPLGTWKPTEVALFRNLTQNLAVRLEQQDKW